MAVDTSTNLKATAFSNQKKIIELSTGRLVVVHGETTTNAELLWSDDGVSWTDYGVDIAGWSNGSIGCYVDSGGTERIVAAWKQSGTGGGRNSGSIYVMVGSFNSGRTSITWGTAVEFGTTSAAYDYPDVVCCPDHSTGGSAIVAWSYFDGVNGYGTHLRPASISGNTITAGTFRFGLNNAQASFTTSVHGFNSLALDPVTKRAFLVFSAGKSGAGYGIRFQTASYSAGAWTWATEVEVDNTRIVGGDYLWAVVRWDGTRVVIIGELYDGSSNDTMLYESTNFTSFSTTVLISNNVSILYRGCAAVDNTTGDIYLYGNNSSNEWHYYKWTRSGPSLGSKQVIVSDSGTASGLWISVLQGTHVIDFVYTKGSSSPYDIIYGNLSLNVTPNTPTALSHTSSTLDTTPSFSCSISDGNTSQDIKGRFKIYESDGTTLIATVDSSFRNGAGSVSAEYTSALPVGTYKVKASTVDDLGAESAYTALVTFYIKTSVSEDYTFIWNVKERALFDLDLLWGVSVNGQLDVTLIWDVHQNINEDITLQWRTSTPWIIVDDTEEIEWSSP